MVAKRPGLTLSLTTTLISSQVLHTSQSGWSSLNGFTQSQ